MSINVTVNGDAIRINRGRMTKYDADSEFERRKKIRFQQVRQQSKELSATVRSRVKREKERLLSNAEEEGKKQIKNWKARKLQNLNKRYEDCVKEVGTAHTSASNEIDPEQVLRENTTKNKCCAAKRGKVAIEKEHAEQGKRETEAYKTATRRRTVRCMEDARSSLIANLRKRGPRSLRQKNLPPRSHQYNLDTPVISEVIEESDESESERSEASNDSWSEVLQVEDLENQNIEPESETKRPEDIFYKSLNLSDLTSGDDEAQDEESTDSKTVDIDKLLEDHRRPYYEANTKISDFINNREKKNSQTKEQTLPYVPTVKLRRDSIIRDETLPGQEQKIKHYDCRHRFNNEWNGGPIVQKINKDSVEVGSSREDQEREESRKLEAQRDKEALERGRQAIERVRVQKEFKKLMEELPALQKKERLSAMRTHNKDLHMSQERLEERNRQRQNRIENIFEEYYGKAKHLETPMITIKPIKPIKTPLEKEKIPIEVLDVTESPARLNLAEWRPVEEISSSKSQDDVSDAERILEENKKVMIDLLESIKKKRELARAKYNTKKTTENTSQVENQEKQDESQPVVERPKPTLVSIATSPIPSPKLQDNEQEPKKLSSPHPVPSECSTERRQRVKKKYVKNEETQTSAPQSPKQPIPTQTEQNKQATKTTQQEKVQVLKDNLCEIIIKMTDESNVKIQASTTPKSPKKIPRTTRVRKVHRKSEPVKQNKECQTTKSKIYYDVSSSTNYMSPPEIKIAAAKTKQKEPPTDSTSYKDLLHRKPQQENIAFLSETSSSFEQSSRELHQNCEINPRLVKYIKRLLSMSRRNIEELTVSTVSSVTTPGTSILDTSTNNSLLQLQQIMSRYNLNLSDVQKCMECKETKKDEQVDKNQIEKKSQQVTPEPKKQVQDNTRPEITSPICSTFDRYAELSEYCTNRIAALKNLIEKVRKDKEMITNSSASLVPSSDSYPELPSKFVHDISNESRKLMDQEVSSTSSSSNSVERLFLKIDPIVEKRAEKSQVEKKSPKQDQSQPGGSNFVPVLAGIPKRSELEETQGNEEVDSLKLRLMELMKESKPKPPPALLRNNRNNFDMTPHELSTIMENDTLVSGHDESSTKAMVQPCAPTCKVVCVPESIEEVAVSCACSDEDLSNFTEEVIQGKRERGNFEEIMSTKIQNLIQKLVNTDSQLDENTYDSLACSLTCKSPCKRIETPPLLGNSIEEELYKTLPRIDLQTPELTKLSIDGKYKENVSGVQPLSENSTSSSEDLARILQSLGLSWAVQTVKKTQESYALSSSSNSSHTSMKKVTSISLEGSLQDSVSTNSSKVIAGSKSLMCRITGQCQNTPDMVRTPFASGSQNKSTSHHKTSTPIDTSNTSSQEKRKSIFSAESEISSVPEHLYLSIPNETLDTNVSLDKPK